MGFPGLKISCLTIKGKSVASNSPSGDEDRAREEDTADRVESACQNEFIEQLAPINDLRQQITMYLRQVADSFEGTVGSDIRGISSQTGTIDQLLSNILEKTNSLRLKFFSLLEEIDSSRWMPRFSVKKRAELHILFLADIQLQKFQVLSDRVMSCRLAIQDAHRRDVEIRYRRATGLECTPEVLEHLVLGVDDEAINLRNNMAVHLNTQLVDISAVCHGLITHAENQIRSLRERLAEAGTSAAGPSSQGDEHEISTHEEGVTAVADDGTSRNTQESPTSGLSARERIRYYCSKFSFFYRFKFL